MKTSNPDVIAELSYGEGAVKCAAKMLLVKRTDQKTLIGMVTLSSNGLLTGTDSNDRDELRVCEDEMWVGEVIIIPKYKFRRNNREKYFGGLRIDQKLRSCWYLPEYWDEQIFGPPIPKPKNSDSSDPW